MTRANPIPRILLVTPTIGFVPEGMDPNARWIKMRADANGDPCAAVFGALFDVGAQAHLALPNYRSFFRTCMPVGAAARSLTMRDVISSQRLHFAEDRSFYYVDPRRGVARPEDRLKMSLAFQREVINTILPLVQPDLIHCFGWMAGLVPAAARRLHVKSVFTVTELEPVQCPLRSMEEEGIDAASFWQQLYYKRMPAGYEETREFNPANLLASGIFSADVVAFHGEALLRQALGDRTTCLPHHLKLLVETRFMEGSVVRLEPVMQPPLSELDACVAANHYIELYETVLERSLILPESEPLVARHPFDTPKKGGLETQYRKEAQPMKPAKNSLTANKNFTPPPLVALTGLEPACR